MPRHTQCSDQELSPSRQGRSHCVLHPSQPAQTEDTMPPQEEEPALNPGTHVRASPQNRLAPTGHTLPPGTGSQPGGGGAATAWVPAGVPLHAPRGHTCQAPAQRWASGRQLWPGAQRPSPQAVRPSVSFLSLSWMQCPSQGLPGCTPTHPLTPAGSQPNLSPAPSSQHTPSK